VTTATAPDYALHEEAGQAHFLLRRLHSLTGLIFGGYLVVHLVVNATIAQFSGGASGRDVYQVQVNKIHDLPLLWAIEWIAIYLPILFHTVYGIYITLTGQPNATAYPYAKNWFYTLQRASGVVILVFMVFHVFSLKAGLFGARLTFDPHAATRSIAQHMNVSILITWILYPLGILASCYHLANGLWTAAITWGLTVSAGAQRRWGFACAGLFVLTLVLGFVALFAAAAIDPAQIPDSATAAQHAQQGSP
jgi:succinate dehydrogenase / fumarate reductase cytochrome b subunit